MTQRPPIMTLTDAATARVRALLGDGDAAAAEKVLRIGVRTQGCSGLSYHLEYADGPAPGDEPVEADGATVYVDPKATFYLLGTRMDFREDALQSGFVFDNPNEAGRCGCGESFRV